LKYIQRNGSSILIGENAKFYFLEHRSKGVLGYTKKIPYRTGGASIDTLELLFTFPEISNG
jgi:hypothetical protein